MQFHTFLKDSVGFVSNSRVSFFVLSPFVLFCVLWGFFPIKKHQVLLLLPSDFRALMLKQSYKLLKQ